MKDHARARQIVKRAAADVKNPSTKSWLQCDERGTWELMALDLLDQALGDGPIGIKAREMHLTDEQIDEQISIMLAYRALTATIENAKKRSRV